MRSLGAPLPGATSRRTEFAALPGEMAPFDGQQPPPRKPMRPGIALALGFGAMCGGLDTPFSFVSRRADSSRHTGGRYATARCRLESYVYRDAHAVMMDALALTSYCTQYRSLTGTVAISKSPPP